ncbi:SCO family protein [bacterium]|nr:SCO family protein [bacterium]
MMAIPVLAAESVPDAFRQSGIKERLGMAIPLQGTLYDATGTPQRVSSLISPFKPTILVFAYYTCPMLCNLVLTGLQEAIAASGPEWSTRFQVVTISIDPSDTPERALAFQTRYTKALPNPSQWRFFTGDAATVRQLADSVGFGYHYDTRSKEYAHAAGLMFLAPGGVVSRYLYGIEFNKKDFELAVLEVSDRKQVSTVEKVMLFCYNYDPDRRGYAIHARNLMKVAAAFFVLALGTLIWRLNLKRKESSNG